MSNDREPLSGEGSGRKIMVVAGEASGDLHGSNLVAEMSRLRPGLAFCGIGGGRMRERGVHLHRTIQEMAAMGIAEVVVKLPRYIKIYRETVKLLREERPLAVILIDFPDFNLRVARAAHRLGIPVIYYISPQVWAWRRGRVRKIRKWVKKMLVILPFEEELYRGAGVDAEYVGHPILDSVDLSLSEEEAKRTLGLDSDGPILGLLPGSREEEVEAMLPIMLSAAERMRKEIPGLRFLIPVADSLSPSLLRDHLAGRDLEVKLIEKDTHRAIKACRFVVAVSGTVTLEAALLNVPMVVIYRGNFISWLVYKAMVKVSAISLPNLLAGRRVVPELIQYDVNERRIAGEALAILGDPERMAAMREDLAGVRASLGEKGAAERAAAAALRAIGI